MQLRLHGARLSTSFNHGNSDLYLAGVTLKVLSRFLIVSFFLRKHPVINKTNTTKCLANNSLCDLFG